MRRLVVTVAVRVAIGLSLAFGSVPVSTTVAVTCSDVHAIWATGANQAPGDQFDFGGFTQRDLGGRIGAGVTRRDSIVSGSAAADPRWAATPVG
jgi:hypothetical protein